MKEYLSLVSEILNLGDVSGSRTGVDTISSFGHTLKFDLRDGFPILTTKKVLWSTVVDELLWFIRGGHNVNDEDAPKRIWDDWAGPDGDLGRIYGVQWRSWRDSSGETIDQLKLAIDRVKSLPNSRRNIVTAWNVAEVESGECSFPPCHVMFQLRRYGDFLDMSMYQRSADMALGVPFNISSYALLQSMIAHECGLVARKYVHFLADAHIYVNHVQGLKLQLGRNPYVRPTLSFGCPAGTSIFQMEKKDIFLGNYVHHPFIKFQVAV